MVNLQLLPSLAWGKDKLIKVRLSDDSLTPTDNPVVSILQAGSSPANSLNVTLSFNVSNNTYEGTFYVTNDPTSTVTPKLTMLVDSNVQALYTNADEESAVDTLSYSVDQPGSKGYYVEVRSSVRNLHWDLVTLLTKAGWKFVETLPPQVNAQGYVVQFTHVLKTVTTPVLDDDGEAAYSEMFLIIQHLNYPGNQTGNFKNITFKLTPNYYYYDRNLIGSAPDTRQNDILYMFNNLYKLAEYPTYPVNVDFVPAAVSTSIPNVLDIPVNIWGYASNDFFSLVMHGEPSLSADGFGTTSHIYCGQIEPFKEGKMDVGGNFVIAGSSDTASGGNRYGTNTSDGVNSISAYRTYGGLLWQKHYASVIHDDPQGENNKSELYQPSSWSGKFHLSPVYTFHTTDGKRGTLKELMAVNKQGILHLDELEVVKPVDECTPCPVDTNGDPIDANDIDHPEYTNAWKREKYKYYRLTSDSHFLKSFNVKDNYKGIGIAIKMEVDEANIIKFNTSYDIVTGRGVTSWTGLGSVPENAELAGARTESISAGLVTLTAGGNEYVEPVVTGTVSRMQTLTEGGVARAVVVEILINENPEAVAQLTGASASNDGGDPPVAIGAITFPLFRAGELDNVNTGRYGFRGTFYLTTSGATNDVTDTLRYTTGGKIVFTLQGLERTLNM